MGFRFKKSVSLGKGVKLNFNKKSVGVSFGTKGARYSVNSNGRKTTSVGIPGTGLYYTQTSGNTTHKNQTTHNSGKANKMDNSNYNDPQNLPNSRICTECGTSNDFTAKTCSNCGAKLNVDSNKSVILWLIFFFPVGLYKMWAKTNWNKTVKTVVSAVISVICLITLINAAYVDSTTVKASSGLTSIELSRTQDIIELDLSHNYSSEETVNFKTYPQNDYKQSDFNVVSGNPEVATADFEVNELTHDIKLTIKGLKSGETVIYLQSSDNVIKSDEIKVVCSGEKETTTKETTTEPTTETTTEETTTEAATEEETTKDNSRTVYVTPSGEKYHFSKECAGKNAMERTLNEVKGTYDPCKKCAQ